MPIRAIRSEHNPIITPEMDDRIGGNINGPSLIRVPNWIHNPLGQYYLYFAHHQGKFIRMAYADHLLAGGAARPRRSCPGLGRGMPGH